MVQIHPKDRAVTTGMLLGASDYAKMATFKRCNSTVCGTPNSQAVLCRMATKMVSTAQVSSHCDQAGLQRVGEPLTRKGTHEKVHELILGSIVGAKTIYEYVADSCQEEYEGTLPEWYRSPKPKTSNPIP